MKLLVVDDDPMIREVCRVMLNSLGHSVTLSKNGAEAMELFADNSFDLVLSDRMMPEVDGITLLNWIKSISDVPCVLMTADSDQFGEANYSVLKKPFTQAALKVVLDSVDSLVIVNK